MTVTIPHGVKAELVRRTKPVGRREAGDVGAAAAEEALAASTARLVDLLGQHLEPDEELRDVSTSSGYKTGPRVGCAVRVSLLTLTDRRILHVLEDQVKGVAPIVHPYDYGSLTVRGKRMHLGGPTVLVEPDGVVVETRKGKVDEVTARLSAAPPRAEWLTTAWSAVADGGVASSDPLPEG